MDKERIAEIKDFLVKEKDIEVELMHEFGKILTGTLESICPNASFMFPSEHLVEYTIFYLKKSMESQCLPLDNMVFASFKKDQKKEELNQDDIKVLCQIFKQKK